MGVYDNSCLSWENRQFVKFLFDTKNVTANEKEYLDWKKIFINIHGEFNTQRKIRIEKLENSYDIRLSETHDDLFFFLFCLETYYSVILRFLAYNKIFKTADYDEKIFRANIFLEKGIVNYTCVGYYDWFLRLKGISQLLSDLYSSITTRHYNDRDGDLISFIFETIFPKEIRHSLGEFYTPYWLADYVIDQITTDDKERHMKKYIDPSCGSGTFLVALIHKFRSIEGNDIFKNICGIDINPLTVLAAKTNYLLLYSDFCRFEGDLEIPIYCADTIAINDKYHTLFCAEDNYDNVPKLKYDYVVGNPPWVNWEYLPKSYRINHGGLWQYYSLFTQKGLNANFIKEDVSVLMTYVVIDNYLKEGGKLGFVIKETLFKSIKQGEGFRNFRIHPNKTDLNVYRVDDLTALKPFKGAVTRTALVFIKKGEKTNYPVDYIVWHPKGKKNAIDNIYHGKEVSKHVDFVFLKARPSVQNSLNSGWITESLNEMEFSQNILGTNSYTARTGVFTGGANGIYWLRIERETTPNMVVVSNITERAKNKMRNVSAEMEKDFIFPFLTGNELRFWGYSYSKYILCPHTAKSKMYPVGDDVLSKLPKTEAYLCAFKKELEERKGFTSIDEQIHHTYYYTLQRIGEYTFSRYKVCWRYISKAFTPAVVEYADDQYLGRKNIIGNEKVISIGLDSRDEAYYLCGVISSTLYRRTIENYMVGTQITPSILNKLKIPSYDKDNAIHNKISELCRKGHQSDNKEHFVSAIDKIVSDWIFTI